MIDNEKIVMLAKVKPLQPADVAKAADVDTIVAGAILSDLSSKKLLKVSHLKVGSSPLYYVPSNKEQLLKFIDYLNEKDKDTVNLLKEKKVLRPSGESPLVRVSLQNIKDFAVPLEVVLKDRKEIFYKWFLLSDDEAKLIIEHILEKSESFQRKEKTSENVEKQEPLVKKQEKIEERSKPVVKKELQEKKFVEKRMSAPSIDSFFEKNKIKIMQVIENKKKSACEYLIKLPTPVGSVKFFCAVLTKSKISDADISKVIVKSQMRKLPGILLFSGKMTNKAQELSRNISEIIIKRFD